MLKNKKTIIALSIIPQILLLKLLRYFPEGVERLYSNGLYLFISKSLRYVFGWFPFSFGDILYTALIIFGIRWFILNIERLKNDFKNWFTDVFAALAVVYFTFHLLWGFNYYRLPVHNVLNIDNNYNTESLVTVTHSLIKKANSIHIAITKNDSIKVTMPYNIGEMKKMSIIGYSNLLEIYPSLKPFPKSVKSSIYSTPLTYMGFSGYLNPFTNEAQIDDLLPLYQIPTTIAHEQAHQIGYAAENEANFIGCLATIHNDDVYYKFSGYVFAIRYCLNEVYRRDADMYEELTQTINKGILKNFDESSKFWNSYQNPLKPLFHNFYSTFLKANHQEKGIDSYSYVVALLVNYFDNKPL